MRLAVLASLALVAAVPVGESAAPPVSYTIVGTAGANGWYTSNVTVKWTIVDSGDLQQSNCPVADQISTEGTSNRQCTATFTWGTVTSPLVTVKIDKTPPTAVSGSLARAPDANGWFNHPVAAAFTAQDAFSGLAGCTTPTYSGGDSVSAGVTGTCTDQAGNSASAAVGLKYDATPPALSASPDRKPDRKGWYRKPLTITFSGSDVTSGVAACTAPVRYAGPDHEKTTVVGACLDAAGNRAELGQTFAYDATAPTLKAAKAELDKGVARVGWEKAADVVEVELVRAPGINGAKQTTVYQGKGTSFTDKTVKAGKRYRYEIRVADQAGNVAAKAVTALARTSLYTPTTDAVVRAPLLLRWQREAGARFYNVQLYRNGVKVLSTWPRATSLRLRRTWLYAGRRQRLAPGSYRWYVWGARGTRAKPTYGRPLVSSRFVVRGR